MESGLGTCRKTLESPGMPVGIPGLSNVPITSKTAGRKPSSEGPAFAHRSAYQQPSLFPAHPSEDAKNETQPGPPKPAPGLTVPPILFYLSATPILSSAARSHSFILSFHSNTPSFGNAAMLRFGSAAMRQCDNTAIRQWGNVGIAALRQYGNVAMKQCSNAAIR